MTVISSSRLRRYGAVENRCVRPQIRKSSAQTNSGSLKGAARASRLLKEERRKRRRRRLVLTVSVCLDAAQLETRPSSAADRAAVKTQRRAKPRQCERTGSPRVSALRFSV
ncbi:hypothetical protein MHYP_G00311670 [Metynnis hypsauchen]